MSDIDEFEHQLKQEELERSKAEQGASRTKVDPDGTEYEWDDDKKAWFPKIDANFIAQYQMNYGSHAAVDEEATKAVKRAAEISATIKRGAKGKEDGSSEASENADENKTEAASEDWRYYYDLASRYAAREGEEQSAEDKQYYDYYTYYYQYYYTLEQNKAVGKDGESQMDEDQQAAYQKYCKESEEYYDTYYAQQSAEPKQSGERKKKGKHGDADDMDYESKDYWEQYHDENFVPKNVEEVDEKNEPSKDGKNSKRKKKKDPVVPEKRKAEEGWFKIEEEKNTNVYVSGLPDDITDDEFKDLMNKCGLIVYDPKIRGLKVKLYKDADKKPKGDGICCYIKSESVDLALQLLDESELRGHKIHVEKAKFEMKGNYDPNKRKYKKLSNKEKRKAKENQAKLLDWRPDKPAGTKGKADKVVIIKNLFDNKTFETQPELINTIRQSLRQQCANYGDVTKVTIHDHHKDGVATVMFKQPEEADACVTAMGGGLVAGRHVTAEIWDGKTKYEVQETEEQREERLKKWDQYLAEGGEKPAEVGEKPAEAGDKPAEAGEKPAEAGEKPAEAGEKPAEAGEKPDGEKPVVTGEKVADAGAKAGQTTMDKTSVMTLDNVKEDVPQDRQDAGEMHDTKSDEGRSTQGNGEAEAMETSTATVSSTTTEQVSDSGAESRDSCDSVDDSRNTDVDSTCENTGSSER